MQKDGLKPLSQSELEMLYAGEKKITYESKKDSSIAIFQADGKCSVNYGNGTDIGVYELRNGKLCFTWERIENGKVGCFKIYNVRDNKYKAINSDGNL